MRSLSTLSLAWFLLISVSNANTQVKPERAFDFWLGQWELTWSTPKGEQTGSNRIESILNGKVVEESFTSHGDKPLVGKSHSVFDPKRNLWRQTWVDNAGSFLTFAGKMEGSEMVLYGTDPLIQTGEDKLLTRMIFKDIEADTFTWLWQASSDEGQSWETRWKIHYQRKR